MKKLYTVALVLFVLVSFAGCAASRGASPKSPTAPGDGETWATQRATRR